MVVDLPGQRLEGGTGRFLSTPVHAVRWEHRRNIPSKIVRASIPANVDKRLEVVCYLGDGLFFEDFCQSVSTQSGRRETPRTSGRRLTVLMTEISKTVRKQARETETTTTASLSPLM